MFINQFMNISSGEKLPRTSNVKLTPEVRKALEIAVKETLCIGDSQEIEVKINGIIYDLKAQGCLNDVE